MKQGTKVFICLLCVVLATLITVACIFCVYYPHYLRAVLSDCFDLKAVCPQCRGAARLSVRVLCKHDF